jgi:FkbM family methyltransferase
LAETPSYSAAEKQESFGAHGAISAASSRRPAIFSCIGKLADYANVMPASPHLNSETVFQMVPRLARYFFRLLTRPGTVTIGDIKLRIPAGATGSVLHSLYAERYERLERALLPALLRPDDRIVELGSAIGFIGLVTSQTVAPARIVMVEANRDLIPEITHNFALNGVELPDLRHGVAGTSQGTVDFHVDSQFWASTTRPQGDRQHRVDAVEMIDTNALLHGHQANVLICDIEGGEIDLLPSLDLSGLRLVIAELHPAVIGEEGVTRITKLMTDAGLPPRHILNDEVYVFAA